VTIPREFREVWCVDFEYIAGDGEHPWPVCMVAREYYTGREFKWWRTELLRHRRAPFPVDASSLFVAYAASAELACFLSLCWPLPAKVLDLYFEHRCATNVVKPAKDIKLLSALPAYGLAGLDGARKDTMRQRILQGPPYSAAEQAEILDYCRDDTTALTRLLPQMTANLHWPQALLRGRYAAAVARMEWAGAPIDTDIHQRLVEHWETLRLRLIAEVDRHYGIYDWEHFRNDRFVAWLQGRNISWPFFPSGQPMLDARLFRDMATAYPELAPLHQLRQSLGKLRLTGLHVGRDGRNRCSLMPFWTVTGRNQPSNSRYIFGPATWMRSLIRPPPGHGTAYVDWASQEIAIAAALGEDPAMIEGYGSGDFYMAFARRAKLVPPEATADTHPLVRGRCKIVCLGTLYGLSPFGSAAQLGMATAEARVLHQAHLATYSVHWRWSDALVDTAMLTNQLTSIYGWPLRVTAATKPNTIRNFPIQTNAAEAMRLAAIAATEAGLAIVPVHDAFLLTSPLEQLERDTAALREIMRQAGIAVTGGLEIRTDVKIVRYPHRYFDPRGAEMWGRVLGLLSGITPRHVALGGASGRGACPVLSL
jgi:DNA polymerase-1